MISFYVSWWRYFSRFFSTQEVNLGSTFVLISLVGQNFLHYCFPEKLGLGEKEIVYFEV